MAKLSSDRPDRNSGLLHQRSSRVSQIVKPEIGEARLPHDSLECAAEVRRIKVRPLRRGKDEVLANLDVHLRPATGSTLMSLQHFGRLLREVHDAT